MQNIGMISLLLIILNVIFSYKGFNNRNFYETYKFEVEKILLYKDYKRIVTSGFLHVSWMHLIFNMLPLIFFSGSVELSLGGFKFLLIYFASLIAGNLFSLLVHKNHSAYTSVGASGAISGILFAAIALFPGMQIGLFLLPISIPAWLFGLAYILYSIYGIRSRKDNVGHDAHLGGGLTGLIIAILLQPTVLVTNYFAILAIALPSIVFIYIIITRPHALLIDNYFFKKHQQIANIDQLYNMEKIDKQKQVDAILEKIHKRGMGSLSAKEKQALNDYSKTVK